MNLATCWGGVLITANGNPPSDYVYKHFIIHKCAKSPLVSPKETQRTSHKYTNKTALQFSSSDVKHTLMKTHKMIYKNYLFD